MKPKKNYAKYLFILSAILLIAGILLYRNNAVSAQKQVEAIIAADKAGKSVDQDIKKLEAYVKSHMNSSTSFALQGSYSRAVAAAQAAALQQTQGGAKVYTDAQAACSARVDSIQLSNCVTNYIAANSTPGQTAPAPAQVDRDQYIYKFTAPAWSWGAAGIVMLASMSAILLAACLCLI
jgi:ABC-type phosphate/phosphonate transport system substrate-binding protein